MKIPPLYKITPEIKELIEKIDSQRDYFKALLIPINIKEKIQRISLLKSSLFSARIEGNPLSMDEMENDILKKTILFLSPRQEEMYSLIKDHKVVSFDFVRRRFLKVPERTLRYDLKKLLDKGLIVKTGITKGNYYRLAS